MRLKSTIWIIFFFVFVAGCSEEFLETTNPNAPDLNQVLSDPDDWESVISRQFVVLWNGTQGGNLGSAGLAVMADVYTSSWGNWSLLELSREPRKAIQNDEGFQTVEYTYYENFKVIGSANDILRLLNQNPEVEVPNAEGRDIRKKLESCAYFLRGMAYGNIGLKYDQAPYVTEDQSIEEAINIPFAPYHEVIQGALQDLERAIELASSLPDIDVGYFNNLHLDQGTFIRFLRTLQAKYLLHNSRNAAENEANEWQRILNYAQQGIDMDIAVEGDGFQEWSDGYKYFVGWRGNRFPFCRIDHRVIAAMAENFPSRFPEDGSHPLPEPVATDQRLLTDMTYIETNNFPADRGLYHFSHYGLSRYNDYHRTGVGPMPWFLKAENDLMIAEALIRTGGDRSRAADLINITRLGRGGLTPIQATASDQEFYDAIIHERLIELLATNGGQPYYDRRRLPVDDGSLDPYSGLQPGTPVHFPVPARELNVLGMEHYTYGG